jgi:hypothetical protein
MWLAMRSVSKDGLASTTDENRRFEIQMVHGAPESLQRSAFDEWNEVTAQEAKSKLSGWDVEVTNSSDKDTLLGRLDTLNAIVRDAFTPSAECADIEALCRKEMERLETLRPLKSIPSREQLRSVKEEGNSLSPSDDNPPSPFVPRQLTRHPTAPSTAFPSLFERAPSESALSKPRSVSETLEIAVT